MSCFQCFAGLRMPRAAAESKGPDAATAAAAAAATAAAAVAAALQGMQSQFQALGMQSQVQPQGMQSDFQLLESPPPTPSARGQPTAARSITKGNTGRRASIRGWQGFSMEEAVAHADAEHSKASLRTPSEIFADLQRGNTRFWTNTSLRPEASAFERRALISKQFPSVAVLGCSDSRVPTEIVFDQGLGDLFTIRVAGNALDAATVASLQYAVHHLKVKVILVLGHELCGAVKAALLPTEKLEQEPAELARALMSIKAGLDDSRLVHLRDSRALDREAVTTNVKAQVERITKDIGILKKVASGEVLVVGGFYEISSGIVDFFHEVSIDIGRPPSHGVNSCYLAGQA